MGSVLAAEIVFERISERKRQSQRINLSATKSVFGYISGGSLALGMGGLYACRR
jgi:hypothetical protein